MVLCSLSAHQFFGQNQDVSLRSSPPRSGGSVWWWWGFLPEQHFQPQCPCSLFPFPYWAVVAASAAQAVFQRRREQTIIFSPSSLCLSPWGSGKGVFEPEEWQEKKWRRQSRAREETQIHGILHKQELCFFISCCVWAQTATTVAVISSCTYRFVVLFLYPTFRRAPNHCFFSGLLQRLCFHHSFDLRCSSFWCSHHKCSTVLDFSLTLWH